jgi:NAD(P)-dependent dehydrogenase (short-subunit alcohol dehydrogenase family)
VLSLLAWLHLPDYGAYSAAKAAAWAQTSVVRQELAPKGIEVTALHMGYMDTDLADYVDPNEKSDPAVVASAGSTASPPARPRSSPTRSRRT